MTPPSLIAQAQENLAIPAHPVEPRVIVASPDQSSATVIAIPPDTSWTGSIAFKNSKTATKVSSNNMAMWLQSQSALNGLQSVNGHPWHIIVDYDQFDDDGDNVHSGTIEELWASPKKYKITYKSDTLNQTDYATNHGLFRLGDQRWPNHVETQALAEVVNPFSYAATLQNYQTSTLKRTFGTHNLACTVLERTGVISSPTQYCFDPDSSALRYVRGEGWFQTVYNDIASIDGHNVGRDVEVTDGGHPFLKLRVKTVELISSVNESLFVPPTDAVNLAGKTVTGVVEQPIQTVFPEWPMSLRQQHFVVVLEIVIGKNGHVESAHAVSGPDEAYRAAEKAVSKWTFHPYFVLDEPAEVQTKVSLSNN